MEILVLCFLQTHSTSSMANLQSLSRWVTTTEHTHGRDQVRAALVRVQIRRGAPSATVPE